MDTRDGIRIASRPANMGRKTLRKAVIDTNGGKNEIAKHIVLHLEENQGSLYGSIDLRNMPINSTQLILTRDALLRLYKSSGALLRCWDEVESSQEQEVALTGD